MLPDSFFSLTKKERAEVVEHFRKEFLYNSDSSIIKQLLDSVQERVGEACKMFEVKISFNASIIGKVKSFSIFEISKPKELKK